MGCTGSTLHLHPLHPHSRYLAVSKACGMRHPTTGLSEDDLSRLTGSSTTTSTPSHESNGSNKGCSIIPILNDNESINNLKNSQNFNSSYLPEIIDPLEWQKSRKRKERQDSTSSTTQDRKLVRSNSEELISNADYEVIRRVSSHEDFKKPLQEINDENILKAIQENEVTTTTTNNHHQQQNHHNNSGISFMARSRIETSPARSNRMSPSREYRNGKYKENDDSDWEHERRRSSERFCKSRAPPGRKSGVMKKSNKHIGLRYRDRDENVYKYDISSLKYERRGFVSKVKLEERNRKEEAADGEQIPISDYNDNNLIDFRIRGDYNNKFTSAPTPIIQQQQQQQQQQSVTPPKPTPQKPIETVAEALPWDCSISEDQTPVLCRRFAAFEDYGSKDTGSKMSIPLPPVADNEPIRSYRTFTNSENLKTREVMQSLPPTGMFQTPEERLKYINKKLTALKKRITQLEEGFEKTYGYRPSQIEKFNDKQIKSVLAEISKLRKEKHELKADPMAAMRLKVSGGLNPEQKLVKMKESLADIEKKLDEKRHEGHRSLDLDELNSDQLVAEKTAVQHGLLYLESLYGRPTTREERDAVRPLYDRYRIIKRMVTRSVSMSGTGIGTFELPTILEHEAMAFTVESVQPLNISTDTTTSPDVPPPSYAESPSDGSQNSTDSTEASNLGENIHTLSINELWQHLEKVREEKKQLKRNIREYETLFEEQNGRKMLKSDRKGIEDTYAQYKEKKAKFRLLQALIKKHISN